MEIDPIILSLKLASITTLLLFIFCLPLASFITTCSSKFKALFDVISFLPMILPPTVLGFYMLLIFSPFHTIGFYLKNYLGIQLLFNFWGMVLGSFVFSFPLMILPIKNGFENIDKSLLEASYTLGKTKFETVIHIILPNIKSYLAIGILTTFAHTMGEFGVVLIVGGNIPSETKLLSIALFEKIEELDYSTGHQYAFVLLSISISVILVILILNYSAKKGLRYD